MRTGEKINEKSIIFSLVGRYFSLVTGEHMGASVASPADILVYLTRTAARCAFQFCNTSAPNPGVVTNDLSSSPDIKYFQTADTFCVLLTLSRGKIKRMFNMPRPFKRGRRLLARSLHIRGSQL
jgi:hypothetical protein